MGIKIVSRAKVVVEQTFVSAICNKCGIEKQAEDGRLPDDIHPLEFSGGYGGKFPSDLQTVKLTICDKCLEAFCDSCVVPVEVTSSAPGSFQSIRVARFDTAEEYVVECESFCRKVAEPEPRSWGFDQDMSNEGLLEVGLYAEANGRLWEVFDWAYSRTEDLWFAQARQLFGVSEIHIVPANLWSTFKRINYE